MKTALAAVLLLTASAAVAETNPSLATVLSSDGRIMEGVSGSFDPTGFRMTYGPDGEPLFLEESSSPWEPVPHPDGQDSEGTWYPLGSGMNNRVYAIDVSDTGLMYAGGTFTHAGDSEAFFIACWDGGSWHSMGMGSGVNNAVRAIAINGSDVYVGGVFTLAGGNPANRIARWDGNSWHQLGSGVNNQVFAITINGSDVYVGGAFTATGAGIPVSRIARWDGSSWHQLGSGVNSQVNAIAINGSDVYVGGSFTVAGAVAANRIAQWDGSSWHALGSGFEGSAVEVHAIAVSGSDVYVGGSFLQAGGSPASRIARWDGSAWHPLGSGLNESVRAIKVIGSDVYVGGSFVQAGGNPASHIARWDGSSWHAHGGGLNNPARAIAADGSDLYVGGDFTQAGGIYANYIVRWEEDSVGTEPPMGEFVPGEFPSLQAYPNPMVSGTNLSFQSTSVSPLTLSIFDTAGRLVKTQDLGTMPIGSHSHYWDGCDEGGSALASGVYLVRLSSAEQQASTRVVLVR